MPPSNAVDKSNLRTLYISYLRALWPDWSDERIMAEMQAVFAEQKLDQSAKRRQAFRASLLKKLEAIERHPDDWFFKETGIENGQ